MAKKYLNMTPIEIFENYTIDEIIDIQKEIQYEIDKKRQELRTMVGERYRDVIEASDTIKLMQKAASDVIIAINKIVDLCKIIDKLKDEYGQEKEEDPEEKIKKEKEAVEKGITMQIKILIYIPEQIWTAIDDKQFLKATQLFLFAQHIYTGLKFDQNVYKNHPIIKTQWRKMEHFQKRINLHLHTELQRNNLTAEMASDYLAAYLLLENISVSDLLAKFIEFRKVVLQNELKNDLSVHNTVKSLTCSALKLIVNTVQLIYLCFIDSGNGNGLIYEKLNSIVSRDAEPTLNTVELIADSFLLYLPKVVSDFRPVLTHIIDVIDPNSAGSCIQTWLDWIKESIITDLSERLKMVASIKALDNIREEALKIETIDNWELFCQKLSLPRNFNVWFLIFQPLITARVCKLIESKCNQIVEQTEDEVSEALAKASSGKTARPELDLRWFTWKEEKSDVPSKFSLDGENKFVAKGLLMKSKGYSPNVVELCENFDNRLALLLTDLDVYLFGRDTHSERAVVRADIFLSKINPKQTTVEKFSDKTEIQNHLQKVSREQMEKLITKILEKSENVNLTVNERMSYNLMSARFLLALQQLSPNLLKCFKRDGRTSNWTDICIFLQKKRLESWSRWLNLITERLSQLVTDSLRPCQQNDINSMLEFYPNWTSIEIEEKNEDSSVVKSQIRIPSQPNFHLQNVLFQICSKLNTIIPHTLPEQTHKKLIESIINTILSVYETIGENDQIIQSQALQFLFDMKYINLMFISRDNQQLVKRCQDVCQMFRSKIDPFDYDVFYPHIQLAVTMSAQKSQSILGILIIKSEQLASVLGTKQNMNTQLSTSDKDAIVLAMSDTSNVWFPLLPVTAPVVSRTKNTSNTVPSTTESHLAEKKKVIKSSPKNTKTENLSASNLVRSGATSFLSDWFG